jgi:hypothetical protein
MTMDPQEEIRALHKLIESLNAALDAAEARERAAVADAYEKAALKADYHLDMVKPHDPDAPGPDDIAQGYGNAALNIAVAIRALSDTDALAEYVESVRAEERGRWVAFIEQVAQDWEDVGDLQKKYAADYIANAIKQETNDG